MASTIVGPSMSIVMNPRKVRPNAIVAIAAQNLERLLALWLLLSRATPPMPRR
jgi:hypothetical protein